MPERNIKTVNEYYKGEGKMNNHEIDFKLYGDDMQFVEVELDPDETVIAEAGSLMMMEENIKMETLFGDGSSEKGGLMSKCLVPVNE